MKFWITRGENILHAHKHEKGIPIRMRREKILFVRF